MKLKIKAKETRNISILPGFTYLSTMKKIIINNIEPNKLFVKTDDASFNNRVFEESMIIEIAVKIKENRFI